jgi:uncharacterized protein (DUF3084 family)
MCAITDITKDNADLSDAIHAQTAEIARLEQELLALQHESDGQTVKINNLKSEMAVKDEANVALNHDLPH